MVLAVEDQAGDEVASELNELRGACVFAVASTFLSGVVASGLAVAAGLEEEGGAGGIAEAVEATGVWGEDLSVSVRSSEGGRGGAGEEGGSGEGFEGHGVRGV